MSTPTHLIESYNKVMKQVHPNMELKPNTYEYLTKMLMYIYQLADKWNGNLTSVLKTELRKHAESERIKSITKAGMNTKLDNTFKHAGLVFTMENHQYLVGNCRNFSTKEIDIIGYMAVIEYLIAELTELSGNVASDRGKNITTSTHIKHAVNNDEELRILFTSFNPTTIQLLDENLSVTIKSNIQPQINMDGLKPPIPKKINVIDI